MAFKEPTLTLRFKDVEHLADTFHTVFDFVEKPVGLFIADALDPEFAGDPGHQSYVARVKTDPRMTDPIAVNHAWTLDESAKAISTVKETE